MNGQTVIARIGGVVLMPAVLLALSSCANSSSLAEADAATDQAKVVKVESIDSVGEAAAYLEQTLPLYVSSPTTGAVEVWEFPDGSAAAELVMDLWQSNDAWQKGAPAGVTYVAVFRAQEGSFIAPRPRPGFSDQVTGDTFVLIVNAGSGIESRATTSWEEAGLQLDQGSVLYQSVETIAPASTD